MINFDKMFSLLERIDSQYRTYKQTLNECMLTEADSRLKVVDRILNERFGNLLNLDGTVRGEEYYVNNNPNTTWRQYLLFNLRHTFGLMQNSDIKYLPVVARLAYSDDVKFDITNDNSQQIQTLERIVRLMKKDETFFNEVKSNPNITFNDLSQRFKEQFDSEDAEDARKANAVQGGNSEYKVVEVTDFQTAKYYGDRSYSNRLLCYTQGEDTWNLYTNDGRNKAYVCLRNGWENIPEEPTEGYPYDLYGTSMIFVFIDPRGNITTSNVRWNHGYEHDIEGNVDKMFNKATLSQTIGMPFDSTFGVDEGQMFEYLKKAIEEGRNDLSDWAVDNVVIPEGVTQIGEYAFYNCSSLTSIVIPNSVTQIGDTAFEFCESLTSIVIPNSVTQIGRGAFYCCKSLTSIVIPNGVTRIGRSAFAYCESLASIVIPNSVTTIGLTAFYCCKSLTSIVIPNSVTRIGTTAFYCCKSLTSIVIPDSVTSIGNYAFDDCPQLTVYVGSERVAELLRQSDFKGKIEFEKNI